ncbi:MAG: hypothetical protein Q9M48_13190, partial [Rhodobacterales bacterium]|nr:hypothetical protein [Rhodobacterales bacterium]
VFVPAFSDITLSDMSQHPQSAKRLAVLDRFEARHISVDYAASTATITGTSAAQRQQELNAEPVNGLEEYEASLTVYLRNMLRPTDIQLHEPFVQHLKEALPMIRSIDEMCNSSGLKADFSNQISEVRKELSSLNTETVTQFVERADHSTGGGAQSIGGLQPPNLIEKIALKMKPEDAVGFRELMKKETISFTGMLERSFYLAALGFGRDNRIRKADDLKTIKGARSEMHDHQHICIGLLCPILLTADRGLAIKAYALAERYKIQTHIIFVQKDGSPIRLSENTWPW